MSNTYLVELQVTTSDSRILVQVWADTPIEAVELAAEIWGYEPTGVARLPFAPSGSTRTSRRGEHIRPVTSQEKYTIEGWI